MKSPEGTVELKAYTTKEIAALYGISTKTFRTWMLPHQCTIGAKTGRYFTVLQVRLIFDKLGLPGYYTLLFLPLFLPLFESNEYIAFGITQGMA